MKRLVMKKNYLVSKLILGIIAMSFQFNAFSETCIRDILPQIQLPFLSLTQFSSAPVISKERRPDFKVDLELLNSLVRILVGL